MPVGCCGPHRCPSRGKECDRRRRSARACSRVDPGNAMNDSQLTLFDIELGDVVAVREWTERMIRRCRPHRGIVPTGNAAPRHGKLTPPTRQEPRHWSSPATTSENRNRGRRHRSLHILCATEPEPSGPRQGRQRPNRHRPDRTARAAHRSAQEPRSCRLQALPPMLPCPSQRLTRSPIADKVTVGGPA